MPSYNAYYPATYQGPVQPMQYPQQSAPSYSYSAPQMMQAPSNAGIIWVQGDIGARAYPSPTPGSSILLMDSEDKRFFIKSTDASGMPLPLRTFSYTEEVTAQQKSFDAPQLPDMSQYMTRQEVEEMISERIPGQATTKRGKTE